MVGRVIRVTAVGQLRLVDRSEFESLAEKFTVAAPVPGDPARTAVVGVDIAGLDGSGPWIVLGRSSPETPAVALGFAVPLFVVVSSSYPRAALLFAELLFACLALPILFRFSPIVHPGRCFGS